MMDVMDLDRCKCSVLSLVMKGEWYDMIKCGKKREEYRDATDYWLKRLSRWDLSPGIPVVEFRRGYAANAPRMAFWCMGLNIESGMKAYAYIDYSTRPEWGEPKSPHFIVRLGGEVRLRGSASLRAI